MTGNQLSDMTISAGIPSGGFVPFVITSAEPGFSLTSNYIYDLGADLLTRVSYTALAQSTAAALVGSTGPSTVQADIDARPTSAVLAASGGAGLIGEQLALTDTVSGTQEDWNRDRISIMRWIPVNLRAGIRDRSGTTDLSTYIQNALDNVPQGAALYAPSGTYRMAGAVSTTRSITLVGDPSRENFDNSWDAGAGGTLFDYRGTTGDAFTFSAPDAENSRVNVCLWNFTVRGSRVSSAGTAGNCVTINGRTGYGATFVRLDVRNVHCCEAPNRGMSLTGLVYGGKIDNCFFHSNGWSGFGTDAGGADVGEIVMDRIRCFSNGHLAGTAQQRANFLWVAGSLNVGMLSVSEGQADGVILGGGPINIDFLQSESNVGDQIILGQSGASAQVTINGYSIQPGAAYTNSCINITADTVRTVLGNGIIGDSLGVGGLHLERAAGAGSLSVLSPLRTATTLTVDDNANTDIGYLTHAFCQVFARLTTGGTDVTGDGTDVDFICESEILDVGGNYNSSTGVFTATLSGLYDIEWAIPLEQLDAAHDRCSVFVVATSYSRQYFPGNVGAMRNANNRLTLNGTARVPMVGGDTLKISFNVTGGTKVVDTMGGGTFGFLSITTAH